MTVSAIDALSRACFRSFAGLPGARVLDDGRIFGARTDIPLTFFNGIAEARIEAGEIPRVIESFEARPFRWWTHAPDLEVGLIANGMRHAFDSKGMVADLARLPGLDPPRTLTIERVSDLSLWIDVFLEGFHKPGEERDDWLRAYAHCDSSWTHFLGSVEGRPVATTSLLVAGELAGVYHVVTLPPFRGRGVGAAMTYAAIREGIDRGARTGVLQSSEMGVNVYRSVGFEAVCDLRLFVRL